MNVKVLLLLVAAAAISGCGNAEQPPVSTAAGVETAQAAGQAAPVAASAGGIPIGSYECWANGEARMLMNFTVTAPGAYKGSDDSTGTFSVGPDGLVAFTGIVMETLPEGFSAHYHEPGGHPTVSFRSGRGAEAAFCEKA